AFAAQKESVPMPNGPERQKIAILGGGAGALSAAFGLTERPNWSDAYEITVYQLGWRLGGKGTSGRNPRAQQRIAEPGPHGRAGILGGGLRCAAPRRRRGGRGPGGAAGDLARRFQAAQLHHGRGGSPGPLGPLAREFADQPTAAGRRRRPAFPVGVRSFHPP